jgi:hypothetical protein
MSDAVVIAHIRKSSKSVSRLLLVSLSERLDSALLSFNADVLVSLLDRVESTHLHRNTGRQLPKNIELIEYPISSLVPCPYSVIKPIAQLIADRLLHGKTVLVQCTPDYIRSSSVCVNCLNCLGVPRLTSVRLFNQLTHRQVILQRGKRKTLDQPQVVS